MLARYLAGYGRTRHQGHDRAEESGERDIIHTSHTLPRDRGGGIRIGRGDIWKTYEGTWRGHLGKAA